MRKVYEKPIVGIIALNIDETIADQSAGGSYGDGKSSGLEEV